MVSLTFVYFYTHLSKKTMASMKKGGKGKLKRSETVVYNPDMLFRTSRMGPSVVKPEEIEYYESKSPLTAFPFPLPAVDSSFANYYKRKDISDEMTMFYFKQTQCQIDLGYKNSDVVTKVVHTEFERDVNKGIKLCTYLETVNAEGLIELENYIVNQFLAFELENLPLFMQHLGKAQFKSSIAPFTSEKQEGEGGSEMTSFRVKIVNKPSFSKTLLYHRESLAINSPCASFNDQTSLPIALSWPQFINGYKDIGIFVSCGVTPHFIWANTENWGIVWKANYFCINAVSQDKASDDEAMLKIRDLETVHFLTYD
jgi:hypothetical protein